MSVEHADPADGISLIARERQRQIDIERFGAEDDDEYVDGELAGAAASYAASAQRQVSDGVPPSAILPLQTWRWNHRFWKPRSPLRDLARAGALIAAEIDRLLRAQKDTPRS